MLRFSTFMDSTSPDGLVTYTDLTIDVGDFVDFVILGYWNNLLDVHRRCR